MMKRHRVLIADNDIRARDALVSLLTTVPEIEVVGEAASGMEAVQLVEEVQPDVVVMDFLISGLTGLEATQLIKQSWPDIVIIVLTINNNHKADCLAAGADTFLIKGAPIEALLAAILD